jgi:hypothetical protein
MILTCYGIRAGALRRLDTVFTQAHIRFRAAWSVIAMSRLLLTGELIVLHALFTALNKALKLIARLTRFTEQLEGSYLD